MLSPRISAAAEESFIPEENVQAIMKLIEKQLKIRQFGEEDMVLNIEHEDVKWKILVSKKDAREKHKKINLKHLNLIVLGRTLGEGSQGKVVLGQDIVSGKLTAVKIQTANSPSFDTDLSIERRNLSVTKRLHACAKEIPDDLKLEGLSRDQADAQIQKATIHYTAMEYVPGLSLRHFIKNKDFDILIATRMAIYAIQEVSGLHADGLVHRDIKTDNFVVNSPGRLQDVTALKLIDLGTGILHTEKAKEDAGTLGFMPPEYLQDVKDRPNWDKKCDVWQLGITLGEFLSTEDVEAGIKKYADAQKVTGTKCHLTAEQIKGLMPDIFAPLPTKPTEEKKTSVKPSIEATEAKIKADLRYLLIEVIQKLANVDRDKRPIDDDLKELSRSLLAAYLRAGTLTTLNNPSAMLDNYRRMKRQNTVLHLPRSVSFAPEVDLRQTAKEEPLPSRTTRSQSTAPKREEVISPRISKPFSNEVEGIEKEFKLMSLEPSSSAAAVPSLSSPSLSVISSIVPLSTVPKEESVIDKLRNLQKSFQLHEPAGDMLQGSAGDRLVFSFLNRHLKLAVETHGAAQLRELTALGKIASKYVPTKNVILNEQVELIRKILPVNVN
jgi:serine/threonine protein kinase